MGEHYSQIDFAERRRIQDMRDAKMPVTAIAEALGRHRSTIHREIRRNFYHDPFRDRWGKEYKGYFCTSAQKYARDRRSRRRLKLTLKPVLRDHVIARLREGWSPQQIAGRLKLDASDGATVSHETIYRFIYGPEGRTLRDRFQNLGGTFGAILGLIFGNAEIAFHKTQHAHEGAVRAN